jgi:hypothetical protein
MWCCLFIYIYMRIDASSGCSSCRRRQGNPWDLMMMSSRSRGRITSESVERQCEYYVYIMYIYINIQIDYIKYIYNIYIYNATSYKLYIHYIYIHIMGLFNGQLRFERILDQHCPQWSQRWSTGPVINCSAFLDTYFSLFIHGGISACSSMFERMLNPYVWWSRLTFHAWLPSVSSFGLFILHLW